MIALVIEASTYVGSVALVEEGRVLAERTVAMRGREHEALMPAVAELLGPGSPRGRPGVAPESSIVTPSPTSPFTLHGIVCGAGPGAFTSLRIAGGIAKGLALAGGLPLFPVSSLALLVASADRPAGRYLAALDAMRGEHYVQGFDVGADGTITSLGEVRLVASAELEAAGLSARATVIGPGQHGDRHADPHARGAARITNMIEAAGAADLASWEPAYGRLAEAQVKWEVANGRPLVQA